MTAQILTQSRLKELLRYDPTTGLFSRFSGKVAGAIRPDGYVRIMVARELFYAHRLAFLYMTGSFPTEQADHINGNRTDNRWINLRAVNNLENHKNQRIPISNTSGVIGVHRAKKKNQWQAQIRHKGRRIHLGLFATIEEAAAAREKASKQYGFHDNHGKRYS